jgi:hypothetical protein
LRHDERLAGVTIDGLRRSRVRFWEHRAGPITGARIAITPHWVRYYDFGAGRLPRFLQDLAERNRS